MLSWQIPSKTFLAGEYLALQQGQAIILATSPVFELQVGGSGFSAQGIHQDSPAGRFIKKNGVRFEDRKINFIDPHQGRGGWGASSAQFLATYALNDINKNDFAEIKTPAGTLRLLQEYRAVAWNGTGLPPSGADLVGQLFGGISFVDTKKAEVESLNWNFSDLEFYLIPTGFKVSTHEHLQTISKVDTAELENIFAQIKLAMDKAESLTLIEGIDLYSKELERQNLVWPASKNLIRELQSVDGVMAVKGCGAMGADVVLALVDRNAVYSFEKYLAMRKINFVKSAHLCGGLFADLQSSLEVSP